MSREAARARMHREARRLQVLYPDLDLEVEKVKYQLLRHMPAEVVADLMTLTPELTRYYEMWVEWWRTQTKDFYGERE
jgi:hypothetical protein